MADINFSKLFNELKDDAIKLALNQGKKYKKQAQNDALALLENMKSDLESWTLQLAKGEISKEDFQFSILGNKELIEMHALKQKGLAVIHITAFKENLLNLVLKKFISVI